MIKIYNAFFLFVALLLFGTTLYSQEPVHDPSTIIKGDDNRYYVFSTGDGVYGLSSTNPNFTNFKEEPTPLSKTNYPSWIDSYVTNFEGNFWAPDIIYMNGYYYLYYSASSFGTSRSVIGVTRTESLSSPNWQDQGMVVYSSGGRSEINAIDPALFKDDDGKIWMSYGSFHGGIGIIEIDPNSGKTIGGLSHLVGGNHQDYEAPFIMKNDGYYYLFINRGKCCDLLKSTYYVTVYRASSVTGPYSGARTFLTSQNGNIVGPGHIGYNENTLSFHYYDGFSNGYPRLFTTTLSFENGWPVAGDLGVEFGRVNGKYALIAKHSNKAMTLEDLPPINGVNIMQSEYISDDTQKFIITNEEGNWHSIKSLANNEVALDVFEISQDDGANINLWEYWGGAGQQFALMKEGEDEYRLINRNSNRCVDVANASHSDGANILQWGCFKVAPQQTFKLINLEATSIENFNMEDVDIYPNPSNGIFTIKIDSPNGHIQLFNGMGDLVFEDYVTDSYKVVNSGLKSGIYIVKITTEKGVSSRKLIIK